MSLIDGVEWWVMMLEMRVAEEKKIATLHLFHYDRR